VCIYTHTHTHTQTQALAKAVDVCLNGVDLLQKKCNRLRVRYTLIKSHFTQVCGWVCWWVVSPLSLLSLFSLSFSLHTHTHTHSGTGFTR
jgi:hypothetical protein